MSVSAVEVIIDTQESDISLNEPELRRLLHYYTSWSAMEDEKCGSCFQVFLPSVFNATH